MRGLTICQPYSHLIITGEKRVENRTRPCKYRGPLLIHAGKSRKYLDIVKSSTQDEIYEIDLADMAFGAFVGMCNITAEYSIWPVMGMTGSLASEHRWVETHEHTEGPFCRVLENVFRFDAPIPYKGSLGLFRIPFDILMAVKDAKGHFVEPGRRSGE